jgi:hypothetical protein
MKTPKVWARVAYLLAVIGFLIAGWRDHGWIIPLAGVAVAVVLISVAGKNARTRKARGGS